MEQQTLMGISGATSSVEAFLREFGFSVFLPQSDIHPGLIAVHPEKGVLAIDVVEGDRDATVRLNRKVSALRDSIPELARVRVSRRVVDLTATRTTPKTLTFADAVQADWLAVVPLAMAESSAISALESAFAPGLAMDLPQRHALRDDGAEERSARRIVLDAEQSAIAQRDIDDVLVISGPPGSGKSLVLAARARWLAEQHPGWRIQVLCFNRILVPYLQALVGDHPNVSVNTFGKFAHSLGCRVSLNDEARAIRDVARHLPAVRSQPVLDALLVDEWQDFIPAWTELAVATVRPGRGGIALAGDPQQALYRDAATASDLPGRSIEYADLNRPYRSTRQILEVTTALDASMAVPTRDEALDGEPVDLVWAENANQSAAAVARDISLLVHSGERAPQDIGVLVTRKFQMGSLARTLLGEGIPTRTLYANQADQLDLAEPTVKIMTVHSAKGLEFDVVFLVGLEHLPSPDGTPDSNRQGRTGYVGATRARDQLVLTYSKDNVYLERIRAIPDDTLRRWVWPDDYPEV